MPLTGHVRFGGGSRGKGPVLGTSPRGLPCAELPEVQSPAMKFNVRRNDAWNRRRVVSRHGLGAGATSATRSTV